MDHLQMEIEKLELDFVNALSSTIRITKKYFKIFNALVAIFITVHW